MEGHIQYIVKVKSVKFNQTNRWSLSTLSKSVLSLTKLNTFWLKISLKINAEFDEHNIKIEFRIHANTF